MFFIKCLWQQKCGFKFFYLLCIFTILIVFWHSLNFVKNCSPGNSKDELREKIISLLEKQRKHYCWNVSLPIPQHNLPFPKTTNHSGICFSFKKRMTDFKYSKRANRKYPSRLLSAKVNFMGVKPLPIG